MRILFRTDADTQIGTGHLMRCLALAEGLRTEGAECVFLCRSAGLGTLAQKITDAGHRLIPLPEGVESCESTDLPVLAHARWLPGGWKSDAVMCLELLGGTPRADWLVVDHYALDRRWETFMRGAAGRILAIDDLADREHDCDLLIDQNQVAGMDVRYDALVPERCLKLLGPRYALLRPEFSRQLEATSASLPTQAPRLLIMFGGADAQNLSLRTVQVLARTGWQGAVDVVAGPLYPELPSLRAALAELPNTTLHAPAKDVAALMRNADLAIGSPGVASWERCACALPSLTIAQADNQEPIGEALALSGAHWYLGRAENVSDDDIEAALRAWQQNALARQAMRAAAACVCDGRGVSRVVRLLGGGELTIRVAQQDDVELLFAWRNDERTRRQSLDPRPLMLAGHREWFEKTLRRDDVSLLLACRNEVPVACLRFDYRDSHALVSIYTDPELHGHGFGPAALAAAMTWLKTARPGVTVLEADVLASNRASHRLFSSAGFVPVSTRYALNREAECHL